MGQEQRTNDSFIIGAVNHLAEDEKDHHNRMTSIVADGDEEHRIAHNYHSKNLRDLARKQEQDREAEQRDKIIEWYSPLNFFLRQADIFSTRQPATGHWLLEDVRFKAWISGTGKILWCRGMPGSGKTVLVSIVVDTLRTDLARDDIGVAAIYLNHKETTEAHSPSMLLASLWRQLVLSKSISPDLQQLYDKHREPRTRPSEKDDHTILRAIILEYAKVFIIVNALEEYPERQRDALLRRISALGTTVSLLLTSRHNITIDHIIPDSTLTRLEIRAMESDIRRHMDAQITQCSHFLKLIKNQPGLRKEIEARITRHSDGMCVFTVLVENPANFRVDVRTALNNVSGDLNSAYDEVVDRINRQSEGPKKIVWRAFSWITHAKRPMRPSELREVLAIEPNTTALDPDNLLDIDTIFSVCAGLVVCNEEDDTIRLIHYTTPDYLQPIQTHAFPHVPTEITITCITYLSFAVRLRLLDQHPLLEAMCAALQKYYYHRDWKDVITLLVEHGADLNTKVASGTALHIASSHGDYEIACLPTEHGVDISATGDARFDEPHAALYEATSKGHIEICHLLIKHGADVNATGGQFRTALNAASVYGHYEAARLLIAHGADINADGGGYLTALQTTSRHRNYDIFRLLIEYGAGGELDKGYKSTALSLASLEGHEEVLRLLSEHGANVNAQTGEGNPLAAAVYARQNGIVKLLIENGAEVNATEGESQRQTALYTASSNGDSALVRLLIEHGADVHAEALEVAVESPDLNYEAVQILLEAGADPKLQSPNKRLVDDSRQGCRSEASG
ncbi:ankyrin repeat-containing domain protein [Mycena latifolia]|nr:ankyrin repeat-containing domain protein [Mycena latifolia]